MCNVDVLCPDSDCFNSFEYECETEDSGSGSEHQAQCPECGKTVRFDIEYEPVAVNEKI